MNFTLPADAGAQIASSTTSAIASFSSPVILVIGILTAFLILELLIHALTPKPQMTPNSYPERGY